MRSKEVDESIEIFESWIDFNKNNKDIVNKADELIKVQENILSYIEQLEEENKTQRFQLNSAFDNGFIHKDKIRDKIKDIEMQIKGEKAKRYTIPECFIIVEVLKSIIGE